MDLSVFCIAFVPVGFLLLLIYLTFQMIKKNDFSLNEKLIKAAENGNIEEVKTNLNNGINIHIHNDRAFRFASCKGHTEIAKLLLDNGADIHAENDYAIRYALFHDHTETVKLLLDRGANIHIYNDYILRGTSHNKHIKIAALKQHMDQREKLNLIIEEKEGVLSIIEKFDLNEINCDEEIKELRKILKIK